MSNVHLIQIFMLLIKFLNTKLWLKMIVKKKNEYITQQASRWKN